MPGSATAPSGDTGATLPAVAVLCGTDRRVTATAFRGGELTAIMGGGKVDLRDATPAGERMVLDVFAVMGGFEVLVPESWHVVIEVVPVMGSVEDKTRPPTATADAARPSLVVRGFVMMGGVEIKN
jgi:hypothetical protein